MALISNVVAGGTIDPTWGNAVRDATVQVTTSGARPTAAEGMVIYETDTDKLMIYTGAAWVQAVRVGDSTYMPVYVSNSVSGGGSSPPSPTAGQFWYQPDQNVMYLYNGTAFKLVANGATDNTFTGWLAWTATLWENANVSQTVDRAVYCQIGKLVTGVCHITSSGTGTANASGVEVRFSGLPAPAYTTKQLTVGNARYQISGGNYYTLQVQMSSSAFNFKRDGFAYTFGSSSNGAGGNTAIASGDIISFSFTYEAS